MPTQKPASERDNIERRIRAAMWLAGLDFKQLAEKISERDYSADNIRKHFNEDELPTRERHRRLGPIARACGVPVEFFFEPLARLGAGEHPDRFDEVIGAIQAHDVKTERAFTTWTGGDTTLKSLINEMAQLRAELAEQSALVLRAVERAALGLADAAQQELDAEPGSQDTGSTGTGSGGPASGSPRAAG